MKYSAKHPYPSLEYGVSFLGGVFIAVAMLGVAAIFILAELLQQASAVQRWSLILLGLTLSFIGAALIGYCKLDNFKRGVWISFGSSSMRAAFHKKYFIGLCLFVVGSTACGIALMSQFR